jgi:hypothetical protein
MRKIILLFPFILVFGNSVFAQMWNILNKTREKWKYSVKKDNSFAKMNFQISFDREMQGFGRDEAIFIGL